jgi:hypothetical protein
VCALSFFFRYRSCFLVVVASNDKETIQCVINLELVNEVLIGFRADDD